MTRMQHAMSIYESRLQPPGRSAAADAPWRQIRQRATRAPGTAPCIGLRLLEPSLRPRPSRSSDSSNLPLLLRSSSGRSKPSSSASSSSSLSSSVLPAPPTARDPPNPKAILPCGARQCIQPLSAHACPCSGWWDGSLRVLPSFPQASNLALRSRRSAPATVTLLPAWPGLWDGRAP